METKANNVVIDVFKVLGKVSFTERLINSTKEEFSSFLNFL